MWFLQWFQFWIYYSWVSMYYFWSNIGLQWNGFWTGFEPKISKIDLRQRNMTFWEIFAAWFLFTYYTSSQLSLFGSLSHHMSRSWHAENGYVEKYASKKPHIHAHQNPGICMDIDFLFELFCSKSCELWFEKHIKKFRYLSEEWSKIMLTGALGHVWRSKNGQNAQKMNFDLGWRK